MRPKLWLFVLTACGCMRAEMAPAPTAPERTETTLATRRGTFERRVLLSGEIDAAARAQLAVPRVPNGRVTIRYLADETTPVKTGDLIAELDNSTFVTQVKERAIAASQSELDVKRQEWSNGIAQSDRALEVERKRAALRRAEIDADVPPGILPKRDYIEKQMALRKARGELEKAQDSLATQQKTADVDLSIKKLSLDKVRRELKAARDAIAALTLRAPVDGTFLLDDHFAEPRKLQVGDEVFTGMSVVRFPDLAQILVQAWLSDADEGRVALEMPVEATVDAYPDRVLSGRVVNIAPMARPPYERSMRRMIQVTIGLEKTDTSWLRPGLSTRVEVISERKNDAILVPRVALLRLATETRVQLADGRSAAITLGSCNALDCVVAGGIDSDVALGKAAP